MATPPPSRAPLRGEYDRLADAYAAAFVGELAGKPLDRGLLDAFAELVAPSGAVVDIGCGPGQIAAYLAGRGVRSEGLDLSPQMIETARSLFPALPFRSGDFTAMPYADGSLAGVTAFYAIVHLTVAELPALFREVIRCLAPGGLLLLSFHVGDEALHVAELLGRDVDLTFQFLPTEGVRAALLEAGFVIDAVLERQGKPEVEHPSLRAYVLARRP